MSHVYFDNAATTAMRPEVIDRMTAAMRETHGNPSSTHASGRSAKALVENARKQIAKQLNVNAGEIVFTSGGTEADNLVLQSAVADLGIRRIITSKIEHHAVLHCVEMLQQRYNCKVDYVKITSDGCVDLNDLEILLNFSDEKKFVSLMHINNEIGTILDVKKVGELCKENNALFHSDMVQSVGHFELDLQEIPVDFIAASAHKFHGPKGIGFAYIKKNTGLRPLIYGGGQERGSRAGTEAVHSIVGMAEAFKIAYDNLDAERQKVQQLKDYFVKALREKLPGVHFNGVCENADASTYTLINVCLPVPANKALMLLFQMDLKGIACSKGSACQSGSDQGSHVLNAFLSEENLKKPSIRFSFAHDNTKEEVDYVVNVLKEFIEK
ncbi:MAG: cysteine desulfurase family protein [Leeuwenhoekiella sp.]